MCRIRVVPGEFYQLFLEIARSVLYIKIARSFCLYTSYYNITHTVIVTDVKIFLIFTVSAAVKKKNRRLVAGI